MSNAARKERKRLQRNLRDFGQRSQAAALWEPERKTPTLRSAAERPISAEQAMNAALLSRVIGQAVWESKGLG